MKINMILPALGHSGGVQMALNYLEYFSKENNDVACYVPITGAYYGWKKILFPKAIYRFLNSEDLQGKWFDNHFKIKIVPYINNLFVRNADIVIATSWLTSYWVNHLNDDKGKKVYFIQDFETWGNEKENKLVRESYHLPFDLRVTVSTALKEKLLKEEGVSSTVVCNGIRDVFLERPQSDLNPHSKIVIGMPYRGSRGVYDLKNCETGLKALSLFDKNSFTIKMYGFNKPKGLDNGIDFLVNPSIDEIINWYDSVDFFYVPSLYEGWGLPSMEAMSRGCIVLAGKTGCLYEFGKDQQNFIQLNNLKDIYEVKEKVVSALDFPSNILKIEANAKKIVRSYSFSKQAQYFLNQLINIVR